jgi:hypothetical protein
MYNLGSTLSTVLFYDVGEEKTKKANSRPPNECMITIYKPASHMFFYDGDYEIYRRNRDQSLLKRMDNVILEYSVTPADSRNLQFHIFDQLKIGPQYNLHNLV